MTCASTANLETCAYGRCAQPVEDEIGHMQEGERPHLVMIGYCARHAERILTKRGLDAAA